MAQAVSRRPATGEFGVRCRVSPCWICGGQNGTGTGFFPEYFGFNLSVSFRRRSSAWKNEKKKLIIFITVLHNKPQGCSASVASAAGALHHTDIHSDLILLLLKRRFQIFVYV
jgi:hypothetical protein